MALCASRHLSPQRIHADAVVGKAIPKIELARFGVERDVASIDMKETAAEIVHTKCQLAVSLRAA